MRSFCMAAWSYGREVLRNLYRSYVISLGMMDVSPIWIWLGGRKLLLDRLPAICQVLVETVRILLIKVGESR